MNSALDARKLADYIKELNFHHHGHNNVGKHSYTHIGALFTNIVLQAGLNYKTVVQPRVSRVLINYPQAATVKGFLKLIETEKLETIIKWKHFEKLNRLMELLKFADSREINTCAELADFLKLESNRENFLEIKGFGNKTLDYTLKLLNFDTVAVDRHIYTFIELAGLPIVDYKSTKKVVEFAADLLNISRSSIDYSIWKYMSSKNNKALDNQLLLNF